MSDPEFLQWIYDRMLNVYGENPSLDYMRRLRRMAGPERDSQNSSVAVATNSVPKKRAAKR